MPHAQIGILRGTARAQFSIQETPIKAYHKANTALAKGVMVIFTLTDNELLVVWPADIFSIAGINNS